MVIMVIMLFSKLNKNKCKCSSFFKMLASRDTGRQLTSLLCFTGTIQKETVSCQLHMSLSQEKGGFYRGMNNETFWRQNCKFTVKTIEFRIKQTCLVHKKGIQMSNIKNKPNAKTCRSVAIWGHHVVN